MPLTPFNVIAMGVIAAVVLFAMNGITSSMIDQSIADMFKAVISFGG